MEGLIPPIAPAVVLSILVGAFQTCLYVVIRGTIGKHLPLTLVALWLGLARMRFEQSMDDAEFYCERVARAVYRGTFADAMLSPDLSRGERAAIRAMLRCELDGEGAELARNFASERM